MGFKHGDHLNGRARQQDQGCLLILHDDARRRAVGIVQHDTVLNDLGLLPVVLCGLLADAAEKLSDPLPAVDVLHQLSAQHLCHGLLGQVILCGPQAAAQEHDV